MQDVAVFPEHVDFLNTRNGLDIELLQRALELFVVLGSCRLRLTHDLSPDRSLTTCRWCTDIPEVIFARSEMARGQSSNSELTDSVGRSLRLQFSQFNWVHRV